MTVALHSYGNQSVGFYIYEWNIGVIWVNQGELDIKKFYKIFKKVC